MSSKEKDENKFNIGNSNINTSFINEINNNSSIHSIVLNIDFSSNSAPNIRRQNGVNDLNIYFDNSIIADRAHSNEITDDGLLHNILQNGSHTSGGTFHFSNFDLNDNNNSNNNSNNDSNIIISSGSKLKINPFPKNDLSDKKNNNNNMIGGNKVKVKEQLLLKKELNLIKKGKELEEKEKIVESKNEELKKKEKIVAAKNEELQEKEKIVSAKNEELKKKEKIISAKNEELEEKEKIVAAKDEELKKKEKIINEKTKELNKLIEELRELKNQSVSL